MISKKKFFMSGLALTMFLSSVFSGVSSAEDIDVKRVSGQSRYETPVSISREYFKSSNAAVIASGEGFADALVGGSLVSQQKLPMYLCKKNSVSDSVLNEMKRLGVKQVYILGGSNTVSQSVEQKLKASGFGVKRLAGKDRFETAEMIAKERFRLSAKSGENIGDSYVGVDAYNYADALVAGAMVGQFRNELRSYIYPYSKKREIGYEVVFGGYSSIPKNVEVEKRISGKDRYQTSIEAAKQFTTFTGKNLDTIVLVNGKNYPDALAASGICGILGATIITTSPQNISDEAINFINSNGIKKVIVVGGENSVSNTVVQRIKSSVSDSNQGWKVIDGNRYYLENGQKVTGWKEIDGNKYFFDTDGKMKTGWINHTAKIGNITIDNARYYLRPTGQLETQEVVIDGWMIEKNAIAKMTENLANKTALDYIKANDADTYSKIQSKKFVVFSDISKDNVTMEYFVSPIEDYWKIPTEGGFKEGSNNVVKEYKINLYNGMVK